MILIGFGSSLSFCGKAPADIITISLKALGKIGEIQAVSRLYRSPAWPDPAEPPFTNAVARITTPLDAGALLEALHAIEAGFGRRRNRPNAPRTLDLDLIDYEGRIKKAEPGSPLVLPHPGAKTRDFVLLPLADVAPGWRHPESGEAVEVLLRALPAVSARPI